MDESDYEVPLVGLPAMEIPTMDKEYFIDVFMMIPVACVMYCTRKLVMEPFIARHMSRWSTHPFLNDWFYDLLTHLVFLKLGIMLLLNEGWYWPSTDWWVGFPETHFPLSWSAKSYYICFGARYLESIFGDLHRNNYIPKLIHHGASVLLVVLSHGLFNRLGTVVMVTVDHMDIACLMSCVIDKTLAVHSVFFKRLADFFSICYALIGVLCCCACLYMTWSATMESYQFVPEGYVYPLGWREYILYAALFGMTALHFSYLSDAVVYLTTVRFAPRKRLKRRELSDSSVPGLCESVASTIDD